MKTVFSGGDLQEKITAIGVCGPGPVDQRSAGRGVFGAGRLDAVLVAVEVEAGEADPVESPAVSVGDPPVDRARIGEELQERLDCLPGLDGLGRVGGFELLIDGGFPQAEVADAVGEFVGGPVGVADQLDALLLSRLDPGPLAFELVPQDLRRGFFGLQDCIELRPDLISFSLRNGDGSPMVDDVLLDRVDREPRQVVSGQVMLVTDGHVGSVPADSRESSLTDS